MPLNISIPPRSRTSLIRANHYHPVLVTAMASSSTAGPSTPTPAMTHTNWSSSALGYTFEVASSSSTPSTSRGTHESRHDSYQNRQSVSFTAEDAPPPYVADNRDGEDIPLPQYAEKAPEPLTLAMYLFKFGFLFPPFWIFGALILLSPLREPSQSTSNDDGTTESEPGVPAWMPEKTPAERAALIANIRAVEVKWAKRSLCALLIFAVLVASAAAGAWAIMHGA